MTTNVRNTSHPAYRGVVTGEEERFYADLAKSAPLSETIKRIESRFGEVSDGEPAVWLTIDVDDNLKPSREKIAELNGAG